MRLTVRWMEHECRVEVPEPAGVEVRNLLAGFEVVTATAAASDPPDVRVAPDDPEVAFTLEHEVVLHLLRSDTGRTHLHAAAAALPGGGAILALGPSGAGKSTLAHAWCDLGRPVHGDDVVVLDDHGVHPFPRLLKLGGSDGDLAVDPAPLCGWGAPGAPVRRIAVVQWVRGASLTVEPLDTVTVLRALTASLHATGAPPEESLERLIRVAESASAYRVEYGDARAAARALLDDAR
ncbi:MAG: hypothetical protein RQ745_04435 [Longimicrobiales bacterium]|nr:hypothetical protein [Longimicrobiales bacterium]